MKALIVIPDIRKVLTILIVIFIPTPTTIIIGSTEYSGLLSDESSDKERKPDYRIVKSYVLARGLVTFTESTRKTETTAIILKGENVIRLFKKELEN